MNDSSYAKADGHGENPEHHTGGPGDSASRIRRTDSSRVVHGGELKTGNQHKSKTAQ